MQILNNQYSLLTYIICDLFENLTMDDTNTYTRLYSLKVTICYTRIMIKTTSLKLLPEFKYEQQF